MEKSIKSFIVSVLSVAGILLASFLLFAYSQLSAPANATGLPVEEQNVNWLSMSEMLALQKESPRKVMVDVYTDWCGWCKVMEKKTFNDEDVSNFISKHYYAVKLNAESEKKVTFKGKILTESELANAMYVNGYPTVVLMDEKLETISPVEGFRKARPFRRILEAFLEGKKVD